MGFWKKFAKIALPVGAAIATPFTGGTSIAALLGAGAGAASGALDGGWKGALKGGIIGGATGGLAKGLGGKIPGLSGAGKGTMVPGLLQDPALKAGTGMVSNLPGQLGGNKGFWSGLLGAGKNILSNNVAGQADGQPGQGWADAGSVLGGARSNEMAQRMVNGEFMQNYDKLNLAASEENRNRQNDAMKGLARTSYILGGGAKPLPTSINSGILPNLGFGPQPASDAQKQGAAALQGQLLDRLTPEGQFKLTDPNSYANPGKLENTSKWGSLLANGVGASQNFRKQ